MNQKKKQHRVLNKRLTSLLERSPAERLSFSEKLSREAGLVREDFYWVFTFGLLSDLHLGVSGLLESRLIQ